MSIIRTTRSRLTVVYFLAPSHMLRTAAMKATIGSGDKWMPPTSTVVQTSWMRSRYFFVAG